MRAQPGRVASSRWRIAFSVVVGLAVPLGILGLTELADEPSRYRPIMLLVGAVVALAVLAGRDAALVGGATSIVAGWWRVVPPANSFRLENGVDATSLLLLLVTMGGVIVLVTRLEQSLKGAVRERTIGDALFDEAPIGLALFDSALRFTRVNRTLARLNERDASAHLGRRPGDVSTDTATLYDAVLQEALETGDHVSEVAVGTLPDGGEVHWRVDSFPVEVGRDTFVGATIEDITIESIRRQRAELLLEASLLLNGASDLAGVEQRLADLVARELRGRVAIAHVDGDSYRISCTAGYDGAGLAAVAGRLDEPGLAPGPLAACVRDGVPLVTTGLDDADGAPELVARQIAGDVTVVCQPVQRPGGGRPAGAFSVAWPYERRLTEDSEILLRTIAAVAGSAVARIELVEERDADRFRSALDAMIDNVTMARAIRDDGGTIVDFEIEFMNRASRDGAGRSPEEMVGQRVCDLYPQWRTSGMFDRFRRVVQDGEPLVEDRMPYVDELEDGTLIHGFWNLQAVPVEDGYIAASRDVTAVVEAERLAREAREALERERVAVDLLQQAALPTTMPASDWLALGASYRAAAVESPIGGDWFDAFGVGEDRVFLLIADVSGHGPEAASVMVQVRNLVRSVAIEEPIPHRVLERVNHVLFELEQESGPFITAVCATVDLRSRELSWSLAGHPPPVVGGEGWARSIGGFVGPPLAITRDATWRTERMPLGEFDRLVMFTDGLIERRGEALDDGTDRLVAQVASYGDGDPDGLAVALADAVPSPQDDMAVLCASLRTA